MSIRLYFLIIGIIYAIGIEGKPVATGKLAERINQFLIVINSEKEYNTQLESLINLSPTLKNHKKEATLFLKKFFTFQSIRPQIIQLFSEFYTLGDMNALIKFYSTPVGKKHAALESKLEKRMEQIIHEKFIKMAPEMSKWAKETLKIDISADQFKKAISSLNDN